MWEPPLRRASLVCVSMLTLAGSATSQDLALYWYPPPFDWEPWEMETAVPGIEVLAALETCLEPPLDSTSYHIVDVDGDALPDAIYDGPNLQCDGARLEGVRTRILLNRPDGPALAFDTLGTITAVTRPLPRAPIHFTFSTRGCCGDFRVITASYVPARDGDSLRFVPSTRTVWYGLMEMPTAWLPEAIPFEVASETYNLRYAPVIDNTVNPREPPDWRLGNVLAQYTMGARGVALAESADETGRVWWYVLMEDVPRPTWVSVDARLGADTPAAARRFGWMSSRYLTRLEAAPARRE